jgi:hypothetical protein
MLRIYIYIYNYVDKKADRLFPIGFIKYLYLAIIKFLLKVL